MAAKNLSVPCHLNMGLSQEMCLSYSKLYLFYEKNYTCDRHLSTCSAQKKTLIPGRCYKLGKTHTGQRNYKLTRQSNHCDSDQANCFTTLNGNCQTLLQRTIQNEKSVSSLSTLYASHQSKITSVAKRYHPQWLNRSGIFGKIFQPTVKHVFKTFSIQ